MLKESFREIEKHVCDLKWSKRLKSIGIRQDTAFHWFYEPIVDKWNVGYNFDDDVDDNFRCAAYTAQDFVDIFPDKFSFARNEEDWRFICAACDLQFNGTDNMANIFARMLIAITKNKDDENKQEEHKRLQ